MYYDLNELSLEQRIPVMDTEGAVLVTAGAGSGKTRVLTHRIAHLINDKGVYPYNVLAITFTNKAAGEMKNRLSSMLGEFVEGVWISTFHSLCLKILRKYIGELGSHRSDFSVWGEDEKEHCIKRILKSIDEKNGEKNDEKDEKIKEYVKAISDSKNNGLKGGLTLGGAALSGVGIAAMGGFTLPSIIKCS